MSSEIDTADFVVAVDIGGTKVLVCLVDRCGEMIVERWFLTEAYRGPKAVVGDIITAVSEVIQEKNLPLSRIVGIGVASAGPCDSVEGVVVNGPNLGWRNIPVASWLEDGLGIPVRLGNDASLAALGEHLYGAGMGVDNMVYMTVSTGIGGGIVAQGRLYTGGLGISGEIGHMTIRESGPLCSCGRRGCLQSFASGQALARNARERLALGESNLSLFRPLRLLELAKSRPEEITSQILFEAARRGDALSEAVLKEGARYLGMGLVNLILLLDPEMIVIGGGLAVHWDQYIAHAVDFVRATSYPRPLRDLPIVPARLGDRAGIMGAVAFVRQEYENSGHHALPRH